MILHCWRARNSCIPFYYWTDPKAYPISRAAREVKWSAVQQATFISPKKGCFAFIWLYGRFLLLWLFCFFSQRVIAPSYSRTWMTEWATPNLKGSAGRWSGETLCMQWPWNTGVQWLHPTYAFHIHSPATSLSTGVHSGVIESAPSPWWVWTLTSFEFQRRTLLAVVLRSHQDARLITHKL